MVDLASLHTIQNVDAPQQRPSRQTADFGAGQTAQSNGRRPAGGRSGATEVDRAAQRLDDLLLRDGENGPREDVPARGFYLNIVV
jgi:hypothetical protein